MTETTQDWYVYMVRCRNGSLYTGITTDVNRRFEEHQAKDGSGAKYLRGKGPLTLVFQKQLGSRSIALIIESKIKKLPKTKKENLIKDTARLDEIINSLSV